MGGDRALRTTFALVLGSHPPSCTVDIVRRQTAQSRATQGLGPAELGTLIAWVEVRAILRTRRALMLGHVIDPLPLSPLPSLLSPLPSPMSTEY